MDSVYKIVFTLSLLLLTLGQPVVADDTASAPAGLPDYSWDTVPVYIHFGKNDGLTDAEIEFVATHSNFVCLEKGHGTVPHGSSEAGIEHDAARLKAVNPNLRVLYYWNTFLDYGMYDAHQVYESHPEWWLKKLDGSLDLKVGRIKRYDLSHPEVQEWWAEEVRKAVVDGSCDGVFMDAFPQIASAANVRLWGREKYDAVQKGLIDTIRLTREKCGPDCVLMFNGIRNTSSLHTGMEYLEFTDGANVEHFDQFASRDQENVLRDMENMIAAGKMRKVVAMKGWPGFNWLTPGLNDRPHDELLAEARASITFPLACFLIVAEPHSYFSYSWGYREQHGSLEEFPELNRPLGPPQGDAERSGSVFTRSFEYLDVWVDIATKTAKLDWK